MTESTKYHGISQKIIEWHIISEYHRMLQNIIYHIVSIYIISHNNTEYHISENIIEYHTIS
jgi:hypothetical protein